MAAHFKLDDKYGASDCLLVERLPDLPVLRTALGPPNLSGVEASVRVHQSTKGELTMGTHRTRQVRCRTIQFCHETSST